jgi:hypothetical protein
MSESNHDLDAALDAARAGQAWGYDVLFGGLGGPVFG